MKKSMFIKALCLFPLLTILFTRTSTANTGMSARIDSFSFMQSLQALENKVPLTYNSYVQRFINVYTGTQKARFSKVLGLSKYYFPIYEKIFRERNVPEELKYISVIESSLNPHAVSRVGATGLWQFMYETGKIYGLTINDEQDDRKDPVKACNAAASYLLDSYFMYDDWLLAIASYNCGRNNIRWAIEKAGGKKDFWSIREFLPEETRNYVPAFIATVYIMNNSRQLRIVPSESGLPENTDAIPLTSAVSLKEVSKATGISLSLLSALNPSFKDYFINASPEKPGTLVLPQKAPYAYTSLRQLLTRSRNNEQNAAINTASGSAGEN
ncbi:lytic transglycosylase domain-containing protein [Arcticibacter sp. MXS-1]|uniref:lytic transglycosylase domain-containing protein n=1 Tax=Arcticibacter sp. MXS-1 TaxID=3341726 RepID=UPI0035A8A1AC